MKEILTEQQNEELLKALDEAIQNGPWEQSNFLRAIGKNLTDIRENFVKRLGARSKSQVKADANLAQRLALRSGQQEVFISLYSSDGANINSWEKIVANLPRQMISRPIYASEEHVKEIIKTKENKKNEAYLGIYVNQADIVSLPPDKILTDKLGNSLLTLKDRTLDLENISIFAHSGFIYRYNNGHLVRAV